MDIADRQSSYIFEKFSLGAVAFPKHHPLARMRDRTRTPTCRHSGLLYDEQMERRVLYLILMVGLPVLVGQFAFDWINSDLNSAVSHLPTRAILILAVLLVWIAFREYRDRKTRTVR
jgi:hypothetical protein